MSKLPYAVGFGRRLAIMNAKPILDVQVCDHCNLRCAGCLHFAPLAPKHFLDLDEYEADLLRLSRIEGIGGYFEAVLLMGGEPLLHPRVAEVMRTTRRCLPGEHIMLFTNGLLLKRMGEDFWDAIVECDVELSISPYPLKVDYESLAERARARGAQVRLLNSITDMRENSGKEEFLRLALDPDGGCDPARSFTSCLVGGRALQLSRGAIWPCQLAAHHGFFDQRFGYCMHDGPDDSLPLDSIGSAEDIEGFRRRPHPMCRYCDNDALMVAPWERSQLKAEEWLSQACAETV